MGIGNNDMNLTNNLQQFIFHLDYNFFSCTSFDSKTNYFEKIELYDIDIKKTQLNNAVASILDKKINLNKKGNNALGIINTSTHTFIPESLFDKEKTGKYLQFNQKDNQRNDICYNKQKFTDCYSIFSINSDLHKILKKYFHKLHLKSLSSVFVDYALNLNKDTSETIFTNINKSKFQISLIKNQKFIFFNEFQFQNQDEFLYFFLNCFSILNLDTCKTQVNIMSDLEKNNKIFTLLEKYIKHLVFLNRPNNFLYSNDIMKFSEHQHHTLFSQIVCE